MKIDLNSQQIINLKVFLSRTQISGNEVEAFVEILSKLKEEKPKEEAK